MRNDMDEAFYADNHGFSDATYIAIELSTIPTSDPTILPTRLIPTILPSIRLSRAPSTEPNQLENQLVLH